MELNLRKQMNETSQEKLWFVTHSESGPGDPNGFFCPECFKREIEEAVLFLRELVSIVNPENTPRYTCDICGKDYRD